MYFSIDSESFLHWHHLPFHVPRTDSDEDRGELQRVEALLAEFDPDRCVAACDEFFVLSVLSLSLFVLYVLYVLYLFCFVLFDF